MRVAFGALLSSLVFAVPVASAAPPLVPPDEGGLSCNATAYTPVEASGQNVTAYGTISCTYSTTISYVVCLQFLTQGSWATISCRTGNVTAQSISPAHTDGCVSFQTYRSYISANWGSGYWGFTDHASNGIHGSIVCS